MTPSFCIFLNTVLLDVLFVHRPRQVSGFTFLLSLSLKLHLQLPRSDSLDASHLCDLHHDRQAASYSFVPNSGYVVVLAC
jgi:hypothetical protein